MKYIWALLISLIFTSLLFLLLALTTEPSEVVVGQRTPQLEFTSLVLTQEYCDSNEKDIATLISKSKACKSDLECVVGRFGCPHGCATAINKFKVKQIDSLNSGRDECISCVYRCIPSNYNAICENFQCSLSAGEPLAVLNHMPNQIGAKDAPTREYYNV